MNSVAENADVERLKALPKGEVHLHLEGCFEAALIEQWARQEGVALPRPRADLLKFSGLADFLGFLKCDLQSNPLARLAWPPGAMLDAIDAGFKAAEQDGLPRWVCA